MEITFASTYGLCEGVKLALKTLDNVLAKHQDEQIYLLNKIVHNTFISNQLEEKGIIILDDSRSLEEKILSIDHGVIVFSAHGHDKKLDNLAKNRNLIVYDSACPRVNINNNSIIKALNNQETVIYIGIKNHPETVASLSLDSRIIFIDYKNPDYSSLKNIKSCSIHNQTTLIQKDLDVIYEEIGKHVDDMKIVNDICFATSKRQEALLEVKDEDYIFIIGDKISSNSTRLFELSKKLYPHKEVFQVNSLEDVKNISLSSNKKCFITAGASTPNEVIKQIVDYLSLI